MSEQISEPGRDQGTIPPSSRAAPGVPRTLRVRQELNDRGIDALVCALPANVLLATGYWPVVGTAIVVVGRERTVLIAPEDEAELAKGGSADEIRWFKSGSLERIETIGQAVIGPLAEALRSLGVERGRIGYEAGEWFEPASYAAMHLYGAAMGLLLAEALPHATVESADQLLARLRAVKTPEEVERIRAACRIAASAFEAGVGEIRRAATEVESAARFGAGLASPRTPRSGGRVSFMSGSHSAQAHGSYAHSSAKRLAEGDLVLVHCNSYADGYWTDITRTFCLGAPVDRHQRMYAAVFEARAAALAAIAPGVKAREVDRAARDVMRDHGFGKQFKHSTGHGVGFAAMHANALPRLHPRSEETLEVGNVFNVEPAVYLDGLDGMRHCDIIAVTDAGAEVLTAFQTDPRELIL